MRCFLLLCFVAFSCSFPYRGISKTINIGDDGTVEIIVANGKRVVISKAVGNTDEKFIDISVEGPSLPIRKFRVFEQATDKTVGPYNGQFNGQYGKAEWRETRSSEMDTTKDSKYTKDSKKSMSQDALLHSIFSKYEGVVDELSYQSLLKEIEDYVASGEIDTSIYDVLKYLHDQNVQEQTEEFIFNEASPDQRSPSTYLVPRRWVPYEERLWVPQQKQWIPQQRQWIPEQEFVPYTQQRFPEQQQWIPQQQQWIPEQQQWIPQQQQWIPQQQQWIIQQQQFVPQQQQTTGQLSQQGFKYNPWIAYYLGQYWNQQRQNLAQQTPSPVNSGPVLGYPNQYPWQFETTSQGFVY